VDILHLRSMTKFLRRGIIAGGCSIAGLTIGFGVQALVEEGAFESAVPHDAGGVSCALRTDALLEASAYGDFRETTESLANDSRRHGLPGSSEPSYPAYRAYLGDSFRGSVTALAYQSPYKEDNEAFARSYGHTPPEDRPFLPLAGSQIVVDHPGLLEIYQTNIAFSSEEGAIDKMNRLRRGNAPSLVPQAEIPLVLGDDLVMWQRNPEVEKGQRTVGAGVRVGRVVIGFSFQGGTALTVAGVLPHVRDAISTLQAACRGVAK